MSTTDTAELSVYLDGKPQLFGVRVYARRGPWILHKSVQQGVTPLAVHPRGKWTVSDSKTGRSLVKEMPLLAAKQLLEDIAKEVPKTVGIQKRMKAADLFCTWCRLGFIGRPPLPILEKL